MVLVGYSDSEGSGDEDFTRSLDPQANDNMPRKRGFQKVVDRSNPTKIRVNLPDIPSRESVVTTDEPDGPPAKRNKLGGNRTEGFNAMLPTPKRIAASSGHASSGGLGLRKGMSLKTGAAPGFTREAMPAAATDVQEVTDANFEPGIAAPLGRDSSPRQKAIGRTSIESIATTEPEGNVTMFKPLSVARKPQKPKKVATVTANDDAISSDATTREASNGSTASRSQRKERISLFSTYAENDHPLPTRDAAGDYQPTLYTPESTMMNQSDVERSANELPSSSSVHASMSRGGAGTLNTIATDLNLSASERRQLFGRNNRGTQANIVNFDADAEYNANEEFRANQDQEQVKNPVRAIAPGRHSLKQLVNAAVGQKDALEEHFASGRRNKKEAGSKYGW